MKLKFKLLTQDSVMPMKAHPTDAGYDLTATSRVYDKHGALVYGTGIAAEIPEGCVGLIFPRSSIAKYDLALSNSVGVVDAGYRGEIMVKFKPTLVWVDKGRHGADENDYEGSDQTDPDTQQVTFHGRDVHYPDVQEGCEPFPGRVYEVGDRIAQLVIVQLAPTVAVQAEELSDTDRGDGGYGSTGK